MVFTAIPKGVGEGYKDVLRKGIVTGKRTPKVKKKLPLSPPRDKPPEKVPTAVKRTPGKQKSNVGFQRVAEKSVIVDKDVYESRPKPKGPPTPQKSPTTTTDGELPVDYNLYQEPPLSITVGDDTYILKGTPAAARIKTSHPPSKSPFVTVGSNRYVLLQSNETEQQQSPPSTSTRARKQIVESISKSPPVVSIGSDRYVLHETSPQSSPPPSTKTPTKKIVKKAPIHSVNKVGSTYHLQDEEPQHIRRTTPPSSDSDENAITIGNIKYELPQPPPTVPVSTSDCHRLLRSLIANSSEFSKLNLSETERAGIVDAALGSCHPLDPPDVLIDNLISVMTTELRTIANLTHCGPRRQITFENEEKNPRRRIIFSDHDCQPRASIISGSERRRIPSGGGNRHISFDDRFYPDNTTETMARQLSQRRDRGGYMYTPRKTAPVPYPHPLSPEGVQTSRSSRRGRRNSIPYVSPRRNHGTSFGTEVYELYCTVVSEGSARREFLLRLPSPAPWRLCDVVNYLYRSGITATIDESDSIIYCIERLSKRTIVDQPNDPLIQVLGGDRLFVITLLPQDDDPIPCNYRRINTKKVWSAHSRESFAF